MNELYRTEGYRIISDAEENCTPNGVEEISISLFMYMFFVGIGWIVAAAIGAIKGTPCDIVLLSVLASGVLFVISLTRSGRGMRIKLQSFKSNEWNTFHSTGYVFTDNVDNDTNNIKKIMDRYMDQIKDSSKRDKDEDEKRETQKMIENKVKEKYCNQYKTILQKVKE